MQLCTVRWESRESEKDSETPLPPLEHFDVPSEYCQYIEQHVTRRQCGVMRVRVCVWQECGVYVRMPYGAVCCVWVRPQAAVAPDLPGGGRTAAGYTRTTGTSSGTTSYI